VSVAYLSLLRHYAAKVDAELDRVDDLIRQDLERGRQPDWLEAYFDLRIPVEVLALALWGLVTDPRLPTTDGPSTSSPDAAEPSSLSPAD
jgi:hypothetical protein